MDSRRGAEPPGDLTTPFREHLEHCQQLDLRSQLVECADYVQNVDLLVMEFLESYYLVERLWRPDAALVRSLEDSQAELVLEPFYESLELDVVGPSDSDREGLTCLSGAIDPVPQEQHPALSRRGLDFVGLRDGEPGRLVLGVAQSGKDETIFVLLLRALNALAELSPPLRVVQLGREIVRGGIPEDAVFSLQLCVSEPGGGTDARALGELTRDLAEAVSARLATVPQLSGTLDGISLVGVDPEALEARCLRRSWIV